MNREELEQQYFQIKKESENFMNAYRNKHTKNEDASRDGLALTISAIALINSLYVIFFK